MTATSKRDLAILTFLTLDGVMQAPSQPDEDTSRNFETGGWAAPYWDEVMAQVWEEAMSAPYDLLLGRKTYETFATHFTSAANDNPVAARLNAARKFVVSSSLTSAEWNNTHIVSGDVVAEIGALKAMDGPLLQVHGSWQLIQTLLAHDLIDEFRLWAFPAIVGPGKRLFEDAAARPPLSLVKTGATPNGVIMTVYRPGPG